MIVFCGDTHFRDEEPFYSANGSFIDWFSNQEFNSKENTLIHLGDVTHGSLISGRVYQQVLDWFLNRMEFGRIIVIAGNHDYHRTSKSSSIDPLQALDNVEVYRNPQAIEVEGQKVLLLPYYYKSTVSGLPAMKDYYSKLPDNMAGEEWDLIVGHYNDETETVFGSYIDTSYLKGNRVLGHIHFPRGNYAGTPVITRKDERGNNNRIRMWDSASKSFSDIPTPRFLDYYDLTYPEDPYEVEAEYPLWTIKEAPSEDAVYERYALHIASIEKQKQSESDAQEDGEQGTDSKEKSIREHMEDFFATNTYSDDVKHKVQEVVGA